MITADRLMGPDCADDAVWLKPAQERLYQEWAVTTGHRPDASNGTWACEIAYGCRTCNEHLSIPCSLLQEANEIADFLSHSCYSDAVTFLRLYLIILSQFVNQLEDVARLIGVPIGRPPTLVTVWANRWAKHRLHYLSSIIEICFGQSRRRAGANRPKLSTCKAVDDCGKEHPVKVIDYDWLARAVGKEPDLNDANDDQQAVLAVPPLMTFLRATIRYFREFVDACLARPELVRKFQSEHFSLRCWGRG